MKNKDQIEWLKQLLTELETDARNGNCNLCGILATQSKLIKLLESEIDEQKAA